MHLTSAFTSKYHSWVTGLSHSIRYCLMGLLVYGLCKLLFHYFRAPIDEGSKKQVVISEEVTTVDGLAVDWLYNHIYWTNTDRDTIEVCMFMFFHFISSQIKVFIFCYRIFIWLQHFFIQLYFYIAFHHFWIVKQKWQINYSSSKVADFNGDMRKTLYQDRMEEPRAIAVYPSEGWMFWTDWGQNAMIERGGMDGRFREVGGWRCFFLWLKAWFFSLHSILNWTDSNFLQ